LHEPLFLIFLANSIGIFFFGRANMQKRLAIAWCSPLLLIITVNLPTDQPARAFALPEQIVQKVLLQATVYFVRGY
jgi:hypothetical protein